MYYTVYKITNKINGHFYIGKHITKNLDDGYIGSGKLIKAAIKKHGKENFIKEILEFLNTEEEMNEAEKRYVVLGEGSYNLCPGGHGGFGYINSSNLNGAYLGVNKMKELHKDSEWHLWWSERKNEGQTKIDHDIRLKKWKETFKNNGALKANHFKDKNHTEETKKKMSLSHKNKHNGEKNSQFGKPRSEETKAKIRASLQRTRALNKK